MIQKILLGEDKHVLNLTEANLPLLIHGSHGVGASWFSVVLAANLFQGGSKILFFTAYPMAREEFMKQLGEEGHRVFYLEHEDQLEEATAHQVIIVKSGDSELCAKVLKNRPELQERVIFVKNIETILTEELFALVKDNQKLILSGDVEKSVSKEEILAMPFKTHILFSPVVGNPELALPELGKYSGYMFGSEKGVVSIQAV